MKENGKILRDLQRIYPLPVESAIGNQKPVSRGSGNGHGPGVTPAMVEQAVLNAHQIIPDDVLAPIPPFALAEKGDRPIKIKGKKKNGNHHHKSNGKVSKDVIRPSWNRM